MADNLKFKKLTPYTEMNLGIYEQALDFALKEPEMRNIALSGSYGAGKSSVLETYKKSHPEIRFLHISFAHFKDEKEPEPKEITLEGKIINQLVHKIAPEEIPRTSFRIMRRVDERLLRKRIITGAILLLLLCFIIFHDAWCRMVDTLYSGFLRDLLHVTRSGEAVLICCAAIAYIGVNILLEFLKQQNNQRIIKRLSVKGSNADIELFDGNEKEASYFDRYMNEVLYLFEHCGADVIVFEDIDRFEKETIFEKLRELNTLVNRRCRLRFLYLLKDDMFESKDRTKFFDFMIPVIPVVDGSNSYNMLKDFFDKADISPKPTDDFFRGISLYIDDMRILGNIYNEYLIYHSRLYDKDTGLDPDKLLAMIIYKNIFPEDFSQLQIRRGYVFEIFHAKKERCREEKEKLEQEIQELENERRKIEKEHVRSLDELDAIYYEDSHEVRVNGKAAEQFENHAAYIAAIKKNQYKVQRGVYDSYYSRTRWTEADVKEDFDKLLKIPEYAERKEMLEKRTKGRVNQLIGEIVSKRSRLSKLPTLRLKQLLKEENLQDVFGVCRKYETGEPDNFENIKRSPYFPMIKYLVRRGYIDETYPDYMTYFYDNSMKPGDKAFLRTMKDGEKQPYDYALGNPKEVIVQMQQEDFSEDFCLNFDLLDALFHWEEHSNKLEEFLEMLWNYEPVDFISEYIVRGTYGSRLAEEMNRRWPATCSLLLEADIPEERKQMYVKATLCESEEKDIENCNEKNLLTNYINLNPQFLGKIYENEEHVVQQLEALGVKLQQMDAARANEEIWNGVYHKSLYQLNKENVCIILEKKYHIAQPAEQWEKCLSMIHSQESPLRTYVEQNLNEFLEMSMESCKDITDSEATAMFVLNHEKISEECKKAYIGHLKTRLTVLEKVIDKQLWSELLSRNIRYSGENLCTYYFSSGNGLDEVLKDYINSFDKQIQLSRLEIDRKYGDKASEKLLRDVLVNPELKDEKYEQMLSSLGYYYSHFSETGLQEGKMRILIRRKIIRMTIDNLNFLRESYKGLISEFILNSQSEYEKLMREQPQEFELQEVLDAAGADTDAAEKLLQHPEVDLETKKLVLAGRIAALEQTQIEKYLLQIGSQDYLPLFQGKHPTFPRTKGNEAVLQSLKNKGYVTSFDVDKADSTHYRVYGKRRNPIMLAPGKMEKHKKNRRKPEASVIK